MQDYLNKALRSRTTVTVPRMKWTLGILSALFAAGAAAPSSRPGTSALVNMSQEGSSEPITIPTTTQNIFGDVVSVTPPETESIELRHLNDDTRFYPDYHDKDTVDDAHFTGSTDPSRIKRQLDYNDLTYEMYVDPTYNRKRRDVEEPFRIDLAIPADSDSLSSDSSDVQTARGPASDPDSVSTQITYVIISEDDSSSDEAGRTVTKSDQDEHTTEVIDLVIPSSEQGTTNSDSSSSTDSVAERNRVLGAIARTIRSKNERRRSSADTDGSSSSSAQLLTRKRRQVPYYRLPDFLNYRVGRSVSEPDSDDTEPGDAHGLNEQDLSMHGTHSKQYHRVLPLPEFAYEFAELNNPASVYVDGKLRSSPDRGKRALSSAEVETTTEPSVDIVTASYPLGIDATKDNLSLPEGNFLGPRIYAKGDLLREEQPAVTGIVAPMEKEESIPVENGSQIDNIYSVPAEANNMNLPLIIPVVAPTSHPGEEARIELSVPSGYVPYIIQLTPTNNLTSEELTRTAEKQKSETVTQEAETTSEKRIPASPKPEVPTYLSSIPTIVITPSTPTSSGNEVSTQTSAVEEMGSSSEDEMSVSSTTAGWQSAQESSTVPEETQRASKEKRAGWRSISSAPVGEVEEPREKTNSKAPTSGIITQPSLSWNPVPVGEEELPKQQTAKWESVSSAPAEEVQSGRWKPVPVGEEELPKQQTSRWEPISNAPVGEQETRRDRPLEQHRSENNTSSTESPEPRSSSSNQEMSDHEASTEQQRTHAGKQANTIPILEENSVMSPNGSFSYRYKSGNGIQVQESGYLKHEAVEEGSTDSSVVQTVKGSYSYTAPNGRLISVRYVADKGGFQPEVENLPSER